MKLFIKREKCGGFEQGNNLIRFEFQKEHLLKKKFESRIEGESDQRQGDQLDGYCKNMGETK